MTREQVFFGLDGILLADKMRQCKIATRIDELEKELAALRKMKRGEVRGCRNCQT